jgi:ribosomal protein L30/L7E
MIIAIRITGQINLSENTKNLLNALNLKKKFSAALIKEGNPILPKVKDLIAYGEFDETLLEKLKKRSKGKYFALHPPIGGLKKSSKLAWPRGILGNNKDINKLLGRMI